MQVCIFEDNHFVNFLPLAYMRPVYELRCGAQTLREKIENVLPKAHLVLHCRKELSSSYAAENPGMSVNDFNDEDSWFINGRLIADKQLQEFLKIKTRDQVVYSEHNQIAAVFLRKKNIRNFIDHLLDGSADQDVLQDIPTREFSGTLVNYPWDLIHRTASEIEKDFPRLRKSGNQSTSAFKVYPGAHLLNKKNIIIGKRTVIKPGAVLDAEKGPIIIGENVTVMPNVVIEGPVFIGDNSVLKIGAKIYHGTSIGRQCKVGGEVETSIIQSHSNKQHEGFLGHSYLGSWVNLGADTNTSDLKNTYGTIKVRMGKSLIDSGMQFMGLLMGDHSKSGINVMFDTGTIVGVSCNVYGAAIPPKFLPSFTWGGNGVFSEYDLGKSLETARRMMQRRNVQIGTAYESLYRSVFATTVHERKEERIV